MWTDAPATLRAGDSVVVRCVVIAPDILNDWVVPGAQFELWDGGFFASGRVLMRIEEGWPK